MFNVKCPISLAEFKIQKEICKLMGNIISFQASIIKCLQSARGRRVLVVNNYTFPTTLFLLSVVCHGMDTVLHLCLGT